MTLHDRNAMTGQTKQNGGQHSCRPIADDHDIMHRRFQP